MNPPKNLKPYKVYAIEKGTVIDHIPARKALKVIEILRANEAGDSIVTLGINMTSKKMGHKDVVKIENKELTDAELNKIALIAPDAKISKIKNFKVVEKMHVVVPDTFKNIGTCPNPLCVTRNQKVGATFYIIYKHPLKLKCHYCERVFAGDEVVL
ncbi:aspartate carbamoyltransferase regulatory subunit [Candidatus Woesearchaeota archaeon]|nr:aspartate carbamoyltransferase regulatory subunit [Candidatus Woesearchaeota archaeon]